MNTAEYIVKRLEEFGVNEFFGLPGSYNLDIVYAIQNNSNTRWIGCTNELNAGYAADGYARIKGYGAVVTTYGSGELNAISAAAGSMAENVPVIYIAGLPSTEQIERKTLIHGNFLNVDYQNFINAYKQVTASAAFLTRDNAKLEIDRVLKTLVREKKPVYIAVPEDIMRMPISEKAVSYDWISDRKVLDELSAKIAEKIKNSKKPAVIGDVLVKRFDAELEYKEFVEKSGIPFSNFLAGANLADMDSENYLGGYFGKYKNPIVQKYIEETDCLISVGAIYSDINSFGQSLPFDINEHIAIYGNYTYFENKRYNNVKMSELLEAVTNLIELADIETDKTNIGLKSQEPDSEPLRSSYIYSRVQDFVKENDIIFADTGSVSFGAAQMKFPPNTVAEFQSFWCSKGWATPAILGACLAKPSSRVILLTGDGAHISTSMEVGTMLKYGAKPVIVVVNNKGYSSERFICQNSEDSFNNIVSVNYAKFARVFEGDVWASQSNTSDDFDKALKVTQIMNKMCYIEACTDSMDVPSHVKDFVSDIKTQNEKTELPKSNTNNVYDNIKDVILQPQDSNLEFETVVHKAFDTAIIDKSEGE